MTPHPDDETIGAGVAMASMRDCLVLALTDGAPLDPQLWGVPAASREEYAEMRRAEMRVALALVAVTRLHGFGFADLELSSHLVRATELLAQVIDETRPEVVISTPYEGGHPDHDAAAFITAAALASRDSPFAHLEMTSYHLGPDGFRAGSFAGEFGAETLELALTAEEIALKRAMVAAYASQRATLSQFALDREQFRIAPRYDFTRPPNGGAIWYEALGWPQRASVFCESAARALQELSCTL